MKTMVLEPLAREYRGEDIVRRCLIRRLDDDTVKCEDELWFQFPRTIEPPDDDDCDSFMLALLMEAMHEQRKLIIKGSVSRTLLSNLFEFQGAWQKWLPHHYRLIEVEPDQIRTDESPAPGAVCAFSGGVDGTFTVWRHTQKRVSYRTQDILFCSLVHGFDIPIEDTSAFQNAYKNANETLADIGLRAIPLHTNYKKIAKMSWEHSFAAALVAALSNFKRAAGTILMGSGEPYNHLVIPWGSTPITDHLLSSGSFIVIHDGATHNRTEKVQEIATWEKGIENLRVCWEGERMDRNCGHCEKCLRTQLNFLATGNFIPSCFPGFQKDIALPNGLYLKSRAAMAQWRQLITYAERERIQGKWVRRAKWILIRSLARNKLLSQCDRVKRAIARFTH